MFSASRLTGQGDAAMAKRTAEEAIQTVARKAEELMQDGTPTSAPAHPFKGGRRCN